MNDHDGLASLLPSQLHEILVQGFQDVVLVLESLLLVGEFFDLVLAQFDVLVELLLLDDQLVVFVVEVVEHFVLVVVALLKGVEDFLPLLEGFIFVFVLDEIGREHV